MPAGSFPLKLLAVAVVSAVILAAVFSATIVYLVWPRGGSEPEKADPDSFPDSFCFRSRKAGLGDLSGRLEVYYIDDMPPSIRSLFENVDIDVRKLGVERDALGRALILVHARRASEDLLGYTTTLAELLEKCGRCAIAVVNVEPKTKDGEWLGPILKAFGSLGLSVMLPLDPQPERRYGIIDPHDQPPDVQMRSNLFVHSRVLEADMVVFSVNPPGVIIVDQLSPRDFHIVLSAILEWTGLAKQEELPHKIPSAVIEKHEFGKTVEFTEWFVGWIESVPPGVLTTCNQVPGRLLVKVAYHYDGIILPSDPPIIYYYPYVHVSLSGVGYGTCCIGSFCLRYHYPVVFNAVTDWLVRAYHPDQVVRVEVSDWGPKGAGSATNITYTIGESLPGLAIVRYGTGFAEPYAPRFTWEDRSDPEAGIVFTRHYVEPGNYSARDLSGVIFTVGSSSFGVFKPRDPAKPGDPVKIPPMFFYHEFHLILDTGHDVRIAFKIYLHPEEIHRWRLCLEEPPGSS